MQVAAHETHVPARQAQTGPHPRFSCAHVDQGRPPRTEAPPRQGSCATDAPVGVRCARSSPVAEGAPEASRRSLTCVSTIARQTIRQTTTTDKRQDPAPPRQRFGKIHRLPDEAAYDRVFGSATRSRDPLFTVLSRRNDADTARLGLAISKKHCRRATARNRVKRIVRESFRRHAAMLAGLDVVVLAQPQTGDAGNRSLFDSLAKHWQKTRSAHLVRVPDSHLDTRMDDGP